MIKTTSGKFLQNGAYISILIAATMWGLTGLWNRNLMARNLPTTNIVVIRNLGSMILLVVFFSIKDRRVFKIKREHLKYFFGTGVISMLFYSTCCFYCQELCSLSIASILLYTAPSFVVLRSALLWKEPITPQKLTALLLTLVGCACVCGLFSHDVTVTFRGFLAGLASGFFYSLYSIFSRYALAHYDSMTVTVWTFIFAGAASLILLQPAAMSVALSSPSVWFWIIGLVVISTVLPYVFYTRGLTQVDSGRASIIASFEPVVATLSGAILFGEPIGILTVIGILCVLTGVYILR